MAVEFLKAKVAHHPPKGVQHPTHCWCSKWAQVNWKRHRCVSTRFHHVQSRIRDTCSKTSWLSATCVRKERLAKFQVPVGKPPLPITTSRGFIRFWAVLGSFGYMRSLTWLFWLIYSSACHQCSTSPSFDKSSHGLLSVFFLWLFAFFFGRVLGWLWV